MMGGGIVKDEAFCHFEEKNQDQLLQGNCSIVMASKAFTEEKVIEDVVEGKTANQGLADNKLEALLHLVPAVNEVCGKVRAFGVIVDYLILLKRYHIKAFDRERTVFKVRDRMQPLLAVRANAAILQDLLPGDKEVTNEVQLLEKVINYILLLKVNNKVFDGEERQYMAKEKVLKFKSKMIAMLNDLVPGCNEVTCIEQVFDKTINYIEFLKRGIEAFYGEPGKHRIRAKLAWWQDTRNKLAVLQDLVPGFIADIDGWPVFDTLVDYIRQLKHGNEVRISAGSKRKVEKHHLDCPSDRKRKAGQRVESYEELFSEKIRKIKHLLKLPSDTSESTVHDEIFSHLMSKFPKPRVGVYCQRYIQCD